MRLIRRKPPSRPVMETANGRLRAPAPIAVDVRVKILPRTDPGFIALKVR